MGQEFNVEVNERQLLALERAFTKYEVDLDEGLGVVLLGIGEKVAAGARDRFSAIDTRVAQGFGVRLSGAGRVAVAQRQRRTTGLRPDFGSLQMRSALLPAKGEQKEAIVEMAELMLDKIAVANGF